MDVAASIDNVDGCCGVALVMLEDATVPVKNDNDEDGDGVIAMVASREVILARCSAVSLLRCAVGF